MRRPADVTVYHSGLRAVFLLLLAAGVVAAQAATIESLKVDHSGDRYTVTMRARLDVSAQAGYAVLTDFKHLGRLNPAIKKVRLRADGKLYVESKLCVLFFCKTVRQLQTMQASPGYQLTATIVAKHSDFRRGHAHWQFTGLGPHASQLDFSASMVPDFWVPWLIGSIVIQKKLKQQAATTCEGIEKVAHANGH